MKGLPSAERFHVGLIAILATIVVAAHVLGATVLEHTLWGTHAYAFLPSGTLVAALVATLILVGLALRPPAVTLRWRAPASLSARAALWGGIVAVAALLFWWLRIRHALLGDSSPLSHNVPLGEHTHPRQPLSLLVHHEFYQWTRGLFAAPGRTPQDVAFHTLGLDSVVAGAFFVPVAVALARRLVAARPADAGLRAEEGRAGGGVVALAAGLLLTQGYMQLFFGYIENYSWFTLAIGLYLWAGMGVLAGRAPLTLASLALAAAIGLDLAGIIFLPSLALLAVVGLMRPDRRRATTVQVALTLLIFLGLHLSLAALGGFDAWEGFRYMWDLVVRGEATDRSVTFLISWPHLREFFAVELLVGPFAGFLLIPTAAYRLAAPGGKDARLTFVLMAALPAFLGCWMYGDSFLGIPRDWDLFAPMALPFAAAAVHCLATAGMGPRTVRRLLAVATVISVFHTAPWILLNTSEARSLERFKALPSSLGRTENVVAYWYLGHGDRVTARVWFERAVASNPGDAPAQHKLGQYAMDEGHFPEAIGHFEMAVRARPDKSEFRLSLVDALVLGNRLEEARSQLAVLTRAEPGRPELWACTGIVLLGLGRQAEAHAALARAVALAPGEPRYARLLAQGVAPGAFARAVRDDWDALVVK